MNFRALVAFLLWPAVLSAQTVQLVPPLKLDYVAPPLVAVPEGEDHITAVAKDEKAPFSGQLLDTSTAIRWMNYLDQARFRLREDVILERRVCNANMAYYDRVLEVERKASSEIEKDLRDRLLKTEQRAIDAQQEVVNPGFFHSQTFWFLSGVVVSGAIFGVSAYALNQVK